MKLYGNPVLPFSRLVETVAQFTKTNYDFQVVDLFSGQSFNRGSSSKWTFTFLGGQSIEAKLDGSIFFRPSNLTLQHDRSNWRTIRFCPQSSILVKDCPFRWPPLSSLRTVCFDWKISRNLERRTSFRMVRDYESKTSDTMCKFWKWFLGWFCCDLKVPL